MPYNRNDVISRAYLAMQFVASRYATTATELAKELETGRRQASRYLSSMVAVLPVYVREERTGYGARRPTHYYCFDIEWRKKHGYLK